MIVGKRVRLRGADRQDLPLFVTWLNDPEVTRTLMVAFHLSIGEEEQWYEDMLKSHPAEHVLVVEALSEDMWKPIGNCAFIHINWIHRSGGVGIFIGEKSYWNQGYGTEAMQLLLQYGFETLNLNRIWLEVYENNPRAIHVYEKVGFVQEGRKRQDTFKEGQYLDVFLMSILRSEYEDRKSTATS